jgi:hypothetical protein
VVFGKEEGWFGQPLPRRADFLLYRLLLIPVFLKERPRFSFAPYHLTGVIYAIAVPAMAKLKSRFVPLTTQTSITGITEAINPPDVRRINACFRLRRDLL